MGCKSYNNIAFKVYEIDNIGPGVGIFAQDDGTTFELKSLVAGNNITLVPNSDSITISSTGVNILNNIGSGADIGQSISGNTINLRGITSGPGISVSTNPTDVVVANNLIQSADNSIVYNYGQVTSINLAPSYNAPNPVISNIGSLDQDSGTIVQTSPTTVDYYPSPRNRSAAFFTFTTTTSTGATNNSIVRMSPDLRYADDQNLDMLLACGSNGLLYQISPNIAAENLMLGYDGTPIGLTNLLSIAFDALDNLLFYTQLGNANTIRVYDFSTGVDNFFVNASTINGFSAGSTICDLSFCRASSTLYAKGDLSAARLLVITIRPYDHIPPVKYDTIVTYAQPFTLTGGISYSLFVTDSDVAIFSIKPSVGNTQISVSNRIGAGGTTGFSASTIPEANTTTKRIVMASSGTLYCYSSTGNAFYRINSGNSLGGGFTFIKNLTRSYSSFCQSPYGIAVI